MRVAILDDIHGFSRGAAELAIGLAIAVMRQIPAVDRAVKRGEWRTPFTRVLHGKTLGIVGLGHVGRHVAGIALAFGIRVLAWSPRLTAEAARAVGAERRELDDLLRTADVVSIHLTLAPESRGLLDARRIGLMKPRPRTSSTPPGDRSSTKRRWSRPSPVGGLRAPDSTSSMSSRCRQGTR